MSPLEEAELVARCRRQGLGRGAEIAGRIGGLAGDTEDDDLRGEDADVPPGEPGRLGDRHNRLLCC